MDCPGFIAADGATVAPGAVIDPVSDAKNGRLQNITLKVFKVRVASFFFRFEIYFRIMLYSQRRFL